MSKYILVYGSLRKGDYNYDRFKDHFNDDFKYINTLQIEGFDLYNLEMGYPGIKRNPASNIPLTVDIIKVSNLCYEQIYLMETYSGYNTSEFEVFDTNINKKYLCNIFIYTGPVLKDNQVLSGDWINYKQNK